MTKTILVADDSKTIRHAVNLTFFATGYRVVPVASAKEAVEKMREEKPDLVLADIGMPGVDGYQLCEQVKQDARLQSVPVVLMASALGPIDERRVQAARADGLIQKPFDTQTLLEHVTRLTTARVEARPQNGGAVAARAEEQAAKAVAARAEMTTILDESMKAPPPSAASTSGPWLEPPPAPKSQDFAQRKSVDVWATADAPERAAPVERRAQSEAIEDIEIDDVASGRPRPAKTRAAEAIAERAETAMAGMMQAQGAGVSKDELLALAKKTIEDIAWEVVPDLAETIIREEIRRLLTPR